MGGLDEIIKPEHDVDMEGNNVPPQVIVLSLDSGDLAFCYVKTRNGRPEFVVSRRRISSKTSFTKNVGKSVSVDPRYQMNLTLQ